MEELKIDYKSKEWFSLRKDGIGGSDAAAVMGLNHWKSNVELWEEKTGRKTPQNIVNERMELGTKAETPIAEMFEIEHPQYKLTIYKDTVFRKDFMIASLDGALTETVTGKRGILEIKYTEPMSKRAWADWDGRIPDCYYCQLLHYLSVTGWDFAILKARFRVWAMDEMDESGKAMKLAPTEREYRFERKDLSGDIAMIEEEERKFWKYVKTNKKPPMKLPPI